VQPERRVPGPDDNSDTRYVGLFLSNVDVRVFDADFLAGAASGPALSFRLGS
jgi:hypothetical protein